MQMLQIFNEFGWLVHVGILDGVEKKKKQNKQTSKFRAFFELQ